MKLENHTDIEPATVREIVRAVRPPGVAGFDVRVSNLEGSGPGRGRAYPGGSSYHRNGRWFVVVSLAHRKHFPSLPHKASRGGYLPQPWLASREEAAVYYLAHELRHLWHHKVPKGHRVWGARGKFSERDADAYALRKLREWRRRSAPALPAPATITPPPPRVEAPTLPAREPAVKPAAVSGRTALKVARLEARKASWERKLKRAQVALKKIERSLKYYARKVSP
jgi:hypothetical protein